MTNRPRVRLHAGVLPAGEASMPTCGVCRVQIERDETYASVPLGSGRRETRHNTEACLRWEYAPASNLMAGMVVNTHRYMLTEWGGRVDAVIVERTEEFNERGWRAYLLAPVDPSDTSVIEEFRTHREEFFRRMADSLVIDPEPRRVFIADEEWLHFVPEVAA